MALYKFVCYYLYGHGACKSTIYSTFCVAIVALIIFDIYSNNDNNNNWLNQLNKTRRQDKKFIKIWQPKAGLVQYTVQ